MYFVITEIIVAFMTYFCLLNIVNTCSTLFLKARSALLLGCYVVKHIKINVQNYVD